MRTPSYTVLRGGSGPELLGMMHDAMMDHCGYPPGTKHLFQVLHNALAVHVILYLIRRVRSLRCISPSWHSSIGHGQPVYCSLSQPHAAPSGLLGNIISISSTRPVPSARQPLYDAFGTRITRHTAPKGNGARTVGLVKRQCRSLTRSSRSWSSQITYSLL
jgi:hypothetical protein